MTEGQTFEPQSAGSDILTPLKPATENRELSVVAGDTLTRLSEAAQEVGTQAKDVAVSLAQEAGVKTKELLNKQIATSADYTRHIAASVRAAANNLEPNAPQLAELVRFMASRTGEFSHSLRDQNIDQLYERASEYVRRQPALVFSAAAAAGFVLFRIFKAGTERADNGLPPNQPNGTESPSSGFNGR
jgi:hypothetical protein